MTAPVYNIPVVLPDLRKEESYQQVVDALEYLDAVANDIFNRISCRVADNRDHLTALNQRINVARAKIDHLRGSSSKATKVFSSPKYPAPEKVSEYQTIYLDVAPQLQKVRKNRRQIESRLTEVTKDVIRAKARPFVFDVGLRRHRRRGHSVSQRLVTDDPEQSEGLGSLPKHLPSVSSLLLFNTTENPYKKYVVLDPLSGAKTKTRDNIIEDESGLSEAPYSILQGEELGRGQQDSIMYVPVMPELPELEVPESLPHLLQVATDEFYSADVGQSIAPSLANTVVPELPNLADPEAPAATAPDTSLPPAPVGPTETPAPPPPPPPPDPVVAPPLPPVDNSDEEGSEGGDSPPEGVPDVGDERSNLMAEIRKAGGADKAGLKDAKSRKHQRKAKKEEEESGGDLLTDLSAALNRRRKAMSGRDKEKERREERKEDHSLGGGSMMDNISRMIPPPPAPGRPRTETQDSSDPDW